MNVLSNPRLRSRWRQEIDGPQAEHLEFVPCGQILWNTRRQESGPCPDKRERDHKFLILEVKETFLTPHVQKGSLEVKKGGGATP